jgi:hypothetical protein
MSILTERLRDIALKLLVWLAPRRAPNELRRWGFALRRAADQLMLEADRLHIRKR